MKLAIVTMVLLAMALGACDQKTQKAPLSSVSTGQMPARHYDPAVLSLGKQVYQQHCSVCHGAQAQGAPDWRKRKPNGKFPPPPLNGSGHAWHHSRAVLRDVIRNGSQAGQGDMPAWQGKLTDNEIEAVISWFQSLWPDQVYAAWYEMQQRGNQ
jgi:mono/diheme cytochrome c family protein